MVQIKLIYLICRFACLLLIFCSTGLASEDLMQVRMKLGVKIPMRDGVKLSADIWMPEKNAQFPAILMRTPYLKTMPLLQFPEHGKYFASRGYVLLVQDVRGRGDSDGKFDFFRQESEDGYDSIEWIVSQPWSNGKVGMMGISYLGRVQVEAARLRPPHLVCISPTASPARWYELLYPGGAFTAWQHLNWLNHVSERIYQSNFGNSDLMELQKRRPIHRPLLTLDEQMGRRIKEWRDNVEHPVFEDYWQQLQLKSDDYRNMNLPALHVTGWFDGDQPGAIAIWEGMQKYSPARNKQHLLIGPWTHRQTFLGGELNVGELSFTKDSIVDNKAFHLAFFDHYLKGSTSSFDFPRVRIYVTGSNRWIDAEEYPPSSVVYRRLYLNSSGNANSVRGDGRLSWEGPGEDSPDRFTYDPSDPVPSYVDGGTYASDHRSIERRNDVLVYTSEVLEKSLEMIGRVFVHLYASSDARDTDFTAKILDVFPDGRAVNLGSTPAGIIRARLRNNLKRSELLIPGKPELFMIELYDIGHAYLKRHRIRIEISSSAYPFIYPNTNTGNPEATDTDQKIAHQTIYHDQKHPSHVLIPVLKNDG